MNYRIVEVPYRQYVNICVQVKKWFGWTTIKSFETEYDDREEYAYYIREAEELVEILNRK